VRYVVGAHFDRRGAGMGGRSIFYIIGVIVVVVFILSFLGLR
jgi:hypothetical protein